MVKKKSIEELLNSIFTLINEAKNEYDTFLRKDLKSINQFEDKKVLNKVPLNQININKIKNEEKKIYEEKSKIQSSWEDIQFKNKHETSKANFNVNLDNLLKNDTNAKNKFNKLMKEWINKNLKEIIEFEFSEYIKKSKN